MYNHMLSIISLRVLTKETKETHIYMESISDVLTECISFKSFTIFHKCVSIVSGQDLKFTPQLSVAACTTVYTDPSLRYTTMLQGR